MLGSILFLSSFHLGDAERDSLKSLSQVRFTHRGYPNFILVGMSRIRPDGSRVLRKICPEEGVSNLKEIFASTPSRGGNRYPGSRTAAPGRQNLLR